MARIQANFMRQKRVQKGFQILFLLSFFRHCKMAFYRKAQDRGEPKNLGVWEKSPSR